MDLAITLSWIKATKNKLQPLVERRVNRIQELSDIAMWRHVSIPISEADLILSGCLISVLNDSRF